MIEKNYKNINNHFVVSLIPPNLLNSISIVNHSHHINNCHLHPLDSLLSQHLKLVVIDHLHLINILALVHISVVDLFLLEEDYVDLKGNCYLLLKVSFASKVHYYLIQVLINIASVLRAILIVALFIFIWILPVNL